MTELECRFLVWFSDSRWWMKVLIWIALLTGEKRLLRTIARRFLKQHIDEFGKLSTAQQSERGSLEQR